MIRPRGIAKVEEARGSPPVTVEMLERSPCGDLTGDGAASCLSMLLPILLQPQTNLPGQRLGGIEL